MTQMIPTSANMAAVQVDSLEDIPLEMVGKTIPANDYAVFSHKKGVDSLHVTYEHIYGCWLPNSGYELAGPYDLEYYDHRFNPDDLEDSEMFIYLSAREA